MVLEFKKLSGLCRRKRYGDILVGISFMALTFLAIKTFAPDIRSDADTNTASVVSGPYTASISANTLTSINITPTATQTIYTGNAAVSYANSCPYGFNVTMSADSEDTNLTRVGDDDATKTIPSTTTTFLADNTWGYSIDNGSTYNPIPALSNPANIINTFEATTNPATLNLTFGIKTNSDLPSGKYSNDVVYTVSVKPQCLTYGVTWDLDGGTAASGATYPTVINFGQTIDLSSLTPVKDGHAFTGWSNGTNTFDGTETAVDINPSNAPSLTMTAQWELLPTMQEFSCNTLGKGSTIKLRDARDNKTYTVKKLDDGRCWMSENLRIINMTISSADSNLPEGETWTIPASDLTAFDDTYDTSSAYLDSTYGGYYTHYTATAGWGTRSTTSGNSPKDICPKGWRLPTGVEYQTLYEDHYNSPELMVDQAGFALSGYLTAGTHKGRGTKGYYWTSTAISNANVYDMSLNRTSISVPGSANKTRGRAIRCIADMEKMQGFDSNTLSSGESKELEDIRDGKIYSVRKLADGRVWMTENLRLVNKTISSADSNLPSGETYTVPASDLSSFTTSYNTNSAYLDSTYGGYYNFYTATAGWGTDTAESGNSPKDICPKGWRLPTNSEFEKLYNHYNSKDLMMGDPAFVMAGVATNGIIGLRNEHGYYWSSTNSDGDASNLDIKNNGVSPDDYSSLYRGYLVRCVVDETMQNYDTSRLQNVGDSITLTDERDGNKYVVKKLADGKVWMVENLRIQNKTLTPEDSNITSEFILPASRLTRDDFNTNNNTYPDSNSVYIDQTYGGYYSYYAVTAGWGVLSSNKKGNSPVDICPKGWRLPSGGPNGEYTAMLNIDGIQSIANLETYPGYARYGQIDYSGSDLYLWSSTRRDSNAMYTPLIQKRGSSWGAAPNYNWGEGEKNIGLSARCVADDRTIADIDYMQEMTPLICRNTTTPAKEATKYDWDGYYNGNSTYIPRTKLIDKRDNKEYLVSKLADGNCWMSQSLEFDIVANEYIDISNNDGSYSFIRVGENSTQTDTGEVWGVNEDAWRSYKPKSNESYYQSGTTKSSSPSGTGDKYNWEKAGNYYNWYAATAGTGTSSLVDADAPSSICPIGWRLPSNTGLKSHYNLLMTTYGLTSSSADAAKLSLTPLNLNFAGYYSYSTGKMSGQGTAGSYWSSTAYTSATDANRLRFTSTYIYPQVNNKKGFGINIRCVAI